MKLTHQHDKINLNSSTAGNANNLCLVYPISSRFGHNLRRLIVDYLELTSKSKATQEDAERLADELNEKWWSKNRKRSIK
ncbi:MAG: hypothetical protein HC905_12560 [Bacteroidales bacterium]|nr:hypothetical protein [Bacteroidales bacterium]